MRFHGCAGCLKGVTARANPEPSIQPNAGKMISYYWLRGSRWCCWIQWLIHKILLVSNIFMLCCALASENIWRLSLNPKNVQQVSNTLFGLCFIPVEHGMSLFPAKIRSLIRNYCSGFKQVIEKLIVYNLIILMQINCYNTLISQELPNVQCNYRWDTRAGRISLWKTLPNATGEILNYVNKCSKNRECMG